MSGNVLSLAVKTVEKLLGDAGFLVQELEGDNPEYLAKVARLSLSLLNKLEGTLEKSHQEKMSFLTCTLPVGKDTQGNLLAQDISTITDQVIINNFSEDAIMWIYSDVSILNNGEYIVRLVVDIEALKNLKYQRKLDLAGISFSPAKKEVNNLLTIKTAKTLNMFNEFLTENYNIYQEMPDDTSITIQTGRGEIFEQLAEVINDRLNDLINSIGLKGVFITAIIHDEDGITSVRLLLGKKQHVKRLPS